jgi:uncharacterized tellurite resistance protein B-like protein
MLNLIKKALSRKSAPVPKKEEKGHIKRTHLAACALLLEAAHSDYECTEQELSHVLDTIKTNYALSDEHAEELIGLAEEKRRDAVDLWEFADEVNKNFSYTEKIEIIEAVWRVIRADGQLDKYEDHFARKLAHLLRVEHKDMIEAKLRTKGAQPPHKS